MSYETDLPAPPTTLTVKEAIEQGLKITRSAGQPKTGMPVFYVRPANACFNRSRRFVGYDKMQKGIAKWWAPEVKHFEIKNTIVGSNNESNALKEFWRICEGAEIGILVKVKEIKHE